MLPKRIERILENLFIPTVREVMFSPVVTIRPTASVMEAVEVMTEQHVGNIVVVDKEPIGLFTNYDLMGRVLKRGLSLSETKISSVMSSPLVTLGTQESISKAIKRMNEEHISHIVALRGEKLAGVVTMTDIQLRYSQGYRDPKLMLKKYFVDTFAYMTFWSGISFIIQVMIVGLTFQQLLTGTTIGFIVQVALGGPFGRYLDLLRGRFNV